MPQPDFQTKHGDDHLKEKREVGNRHVPNDVLGAIRVANSSTVILTSQHWRQVDAREVLITGDY
jgi:hypothetical protein